KTRTIRSEPAQGDRDTPPRRDSPSRATRAPPLPRGRAAGRAPRRQSPAHPPSATRARDRGRKPHGPSRAEARRVPHGEIYETSSARPADARGLGAAPPAGLRPYPLTGQEPVQGEIPDDWAQ